MTALNPAERYAGLRLLAEGVQAALKTAAAEAEEYRRSVRAKSLDTDYGSVFVTVRKPSIAFDDAQLVEWCDEHYPELVQTVRSVPTRSLTWLRDQRFRIEGDDVVDVETGEVVEWASVMPGSQSLTFRADPDARRVTVAQAQERIEALMAAVQPAIEEPQP